MTTVDALTVILGVGVPTYLFRSGLILALGTREVPEGAERVLSNVGPAVLAALTVSLVAGGQDGLNWLTWPEAGALAVGMGVALWKKSLALTLVAGMATIWVLSPIL